MRELADGLPHVRTVGWVPSVLPYLNAARLSVVPLRYGAGTKRKVIQALMVGHADRDHHASAPRDSASRDGREVLIADDPHALRGRRSSGCCDGRCTWRRLARRGRRHVLAAARARDRRGPFRPGARDRARAARPARPWRRRAGRRRRRGESARVRASSSPGFASVVESDVPPGRPGARRDPRRRRAARLRGADRLALPARSGRQVRGLSPAPTARRRSPTSRSCGRRARRISCCRGQRSGGWPTTRACTSTSTAGYRIDPQRRGRDRLRPGRRAVAAGLRRRDSRRHVRADPPLQPSALGRGLALPQRRRGPAGPGPRRLSGRASRTRPSTSPPRSLGRATSRSTSAGSRSATSPPTGSSDR